MERWALESVAEIAPASFPDSIVDLQRLFRDHYPRIWRVLRSSRVPDNRLDDAVQQVFLIFIERRADVTQGSEGAFLFGTALRLAHSIRRGCQREVPTELDFEAPDVPGLDDLTDQKRARQLLDRLLDELEPELRDVFVLFELEGFTTPEIAKIVEIPLGTAASRLRRARERFQALVKMYSASRVRTKGDVR